ncbi:ABC transporter substrate-binding protein [uncultured Succinatimonas sp.]|uniref:ABC transporter substrate-binding protein n=1 Tax=uncultured Succinatimonas sp. TaxID=1262973 RepID=UPI0025D953F7|nr:ABC transporter substrate-binding protein [uncultured Succinatimonas sp.]
MKRVKLKNLFICFISAVFMLLAEGCSKDSNCDLEIKRQAQSLTTLKVGLFFLNYSLDPKDYFNGWILVRIGAGETLLTLDDAGKLQPNLISGYRILDDKTYELTMRNDVAFSDGTKLDADMVKRNLERIFAKSPRAIQYFDPEKIIADNTANTVTIYTKKPVPEIFYNLCEPLFAVIKLDKENEAQTINIPITTGPYQVTKFVPNERISVKPNPNYRNQSSDISRIDFYYIPDAQSRLIALKAGDLDIINTVDHSDLQLLKQDKNMQVLTGAGPRTNVIYLNHLNEFLKDKTLRQAVSLAVNRENIVKLIGGEIAKGVISYHFDFGKKVNAQKFDPKLANTLLDRAGFIDTNNDGIREMNGKNIELTYRLKRVTKKSPSFLPEKSS